MANSAHFLAITFSPILLSVCGCTFTESPPAARNAMSTDHVAVMERWGAHCNDRLLATEFSLDRAPEFAVGKERLGRIDEVIEEVRGGYGGTLVCEPQNDDLDSAAFLAHYLRAFGDPVNFTAYDYQFERILSRLSATPSVLADPQLDWDIWRAYLLYENTVAIVGDSYKAGPYGRFVRHDLDGAKNLLWMHLSNNADAIRASHTRQKWWIDQLTRGLRAPGGRPMRRWYLLQLVSLSDTKTAALLKDEARSGEERMWPTRRPDPFDPFVHLSWDDLEADESPELPPFSEVIAQLAESQSLTAVLWGIDPSQQPRTAAVETNLALRMTQYAPGVILCQESWSEKPHEFSVHFTRPVGQRSRHSNVSFPLYDSRDGVFFFTYKAKLYVWPKAQMDDGVIQMLHLSGLIDDATHARFLAEGFQKLSVQEL